MRHAALLRPACIRLASTLCALTAAATGFFVAPSGIDTNEGTSIHAPLRTVQRAIDLVEPGDTVYLRGGTYRERVDAREKSGRPGWPITLSAYSNEVPIIKGSDIAEGWVPHAANIWKQTNWILNSQQVFVDGTPLRQIGWPNIFTQTNSYSIYIPEGQVLADMTNGTFFCDTNALTLYIWLNDGSAPSNHEIEVSTRFMLLRMKQPDACYYQVRGIHFRHSNTMGYKRNGWPAVSIGSYCTVEDCDIQWCDYSGIGVGSHTTIRRCNVSNNGVGGVEWSARTNVLVSGCTIYSNNYRGFYEDWNAGGMKIIPDSGGVVESNEVAWNYGDGIWFDMCRVGAPITIRGNYVHDNFAFPRAGRQNENRKGIFIEITTGAEVYNNIVVNNHTGIAISGSDNVRVFNNTIARSRGLAAVHLHTWPRFLRRYDEWASLTSNRVFNNIFYDNRSSWDLAISSVDLSTNNVTFDNSSDHNCFFRPGSPPLLRYGALTWTSLTDWAASTGFDSNSVHRDPHFAPAEDE